MNPRQETLFRSRWCRWGLWAGLWTVLMLLSASERYVSYQVHEKPISWSLALRRASEEWYLLGFLCIGVLWLARRFPLEREAWGRRALLHVGGSLLLTLVYVTSYAAILHGQISVEGTVFRFGEVFQKMILYYCHVNIVIYWLIVLGHHGWLYYQKYQEREVQTAALAAELVRARLDALRMQLNPHFLFNALHTISALIHDDPEAADRMIARLSDLLRVALDQAGAHEIPLRQEIAFLERYLEIEKIRFPDRLSVTTAVEPGLDELLVPCFILQPLVENAVRHGIEAREDPGHVMIAVRRIDGMLELRVGDDGPGFAEANAPSRREGIGLSNTRSRLAHLYGANHRFELATANGGGLEVRLLIPCRTVECACAPRAVVRTRTAAGFPEPDTNGWCP